MLKQVRRNPCLGPGLVTSSKIRTRKIRGLDIDFIRKAPLLSLSTQQVTYSLYQHTHLCVPGHTRTHADGCPRHRHTRFRAPTLGDAHSDAAQAGKRWVPLPGAFLSERSILIQKLPQLWGNNPQVSFSACQE